MKEMKELRAYFLNKHNIEIFINPFKGRVVLRFSVQIYNHIDEYIGLINSLKELLDNK